MRTPKYPTLLFFSALAMIASAADASKPVITVAVCDFAGETDAARYVSKMTTLVTADLTTETNLALVERAELVKALGEQALGLSGVISSDTAAKIGQITGAKILVDGQVMKIGDNHLVVVANIIGTETGRLFAAKVEGAPDNLLDLSSELSRKIAQTISNQATNLIGALQETSSERLGRIIRGITGTNRPSVSVTINWPQGKSRPTLPADTELGLLLLKAGFPVVDERSDRKPDIEITGLNDGSPGGRRNGLFSFHDTIDLKVQDRRSGKIITLDHQSATATESAPAAANRAAIVNAIDALAERVLPLLANQQAEP